MDNRTLMITKKNEIYLIDILNMKTKRKFKFINVENEIKSLYKKEKDIYLNYGNYLYTIKYNKYNLEILTIIRKSQF